MTRTTRGLLKIAAILILPVLFGAVMASMARGHDRYTGWVRPDNGQSCCNMIDCKEVEWEFRRGEDGRSVLWIAPGGVWMPADPAAMLSQPSNDGTAHACFMWVNGRPKPHCIQQPGGAS